MPIVCVATELAAGELRNFVHIGASAARVAGPWSPAAAGCPEIGRLQEKRKFLTTLLFREQHKNKERVNIKMRVRVPFQLKIEIHFWISLSQFKMT